MVLHHNLLVLSQNYIHWWRQTGLNLANGQIVIGHYDQQYQMLFVTQQIHHNQTFIQILTNTHSKINQNKGNKDKVYHIVDD